MQKSMLTQSAVETDALFDTSPAAMAARLTELLQRQLAAGLYTSAANTAALVAMNARAAVAVH